MIQFLVTTVHKKSFSPGINPLTQVFSFWGEPIIAELLVSHLPMAFKGILALMKTESLPQTDLSGSVKISLISLEKLIAKGPNALEVHFSLFMRR